MKDPEFSERLINAEWDSEAASNSSNGLFEALIRVYAENHISLLADITAALADMKVVLLSVNTQKGANGELIVNLTVGCKNSEHYNSIVSRLRGLSHIIDITKGVG